MRSSLPPLRRSKGPKYRAQSAGAVGENEPRWATLRWRSGRSTPPALVAIYVAQGVALIALSWLGIVASPVAIVGVGVLYWAEAFLVMFTLWWGIYGVVGTYVGTVLGAGLLTGIPLVPSLLFGLSDTVAAVVAFLVYRGYAGPRGLSPWGSDVLRNRRATVLFVLLTLIGVNAVGALLGVPTLIAFGLIPASQFAYVLPAWMLGDALMLAVFFPPLTAYLTPALAKRGWLNEGWAY